jgi:hypothetical protein
MPKSMQYIKTVHRLLRLQYGIAAEQEVEIEAIKQSEREGWTEQQFVEWFATKYELTPLNTIHDIYAR